MRFRSLAIVVLTALAVTTATGPAAARPGPTAGRALERRLVARLGAGATVARDRETGQVRALRGGRGPLADARALGDPTTPAMASRAFLDRYGALVGIRAPGRQLRVARVDRSGRTGTYVRYQQQIDGVPVLGGDLVVVVDGRMGVRSVRGETTRDTGVVTRPLIGPGAAMRTARDAVARATGVPAGRLRASAPTRWILDPRLLDAPGLPFARLVWRTDVRDATGLVDWFVAVDARSGDVALRFDQRPTGIPVDAPQRICDQQGKRESVRDRVPCDAADALPTVTLLQDAVRARAATEAAYDFYRLRFGADLAASLGVASGGRLVSTVRYCPAASGGTCPYPNAFWDGGQMVYGTGFASADDVVGHELTHGVTERASGLFYYMQSGAINEALSDIFGESIDLTDDLPFDNDAEDKRWKIGEDLASIGVIRNMADPTLLGDPDTMDSPLWDDDPQETDQGGVHANSGVGNRAFHLMVEGPVPFDPDREIALDQALAVWFLASQSLLTSGSDYDDLATALLLACDQLAGVAGAVKQGTGAPSTDIEAADCEAGGPVRAALAATHMRWDDRTAGTRPAPLCSDPDATPTFLLADPIDADGTGWTFDRDADRRWFADDAYALPDIEHPTTTEPWSLWGRDLAHTGDRRVRRTSSVAVPADGRPVFLWFRHAYGFDDGSEDLDPSATLYDGGVVEVSADGGPWTDIRGLYLSGGPRRRLSSGDTNPLGGRFAYGAESGGFVTARANLSGYPGQSFAGQGVRLGFRIGTDSAYGGEGWFIDDVRLYQCVNAADSDAPSLGALETGIPLASLTRDGRIRFQVGVSDAFAQGFLAYGVQVKVGAGPVQPFGGVIGRAGGMTITGWMPTSTQGQHVTLTATDENGDTATLVRDLDVRLDQETAFSYLGSWAVRTSTAFSGGTARSTATAGRMASITATGQGFAVIAPVGPDRGKARMCLDGGACRTVDLFSPIARPRRVVASWNLAAAGTRTVTVTVLGRKDPRSSSTRVDVDALVVAS